MTVIHYDRKYSAFDQRNQNRWTKQILTNSRLVDKYNLSISNNHFKTTMRPKVFSEEKAYY